MKLTQGRFEESADLIRRHLVTLHDDGDDNSLFVRMGEILLYIDDLKEEVRSYKNCLDIISTRMER